MKNLFKQKFALLAVASVFVLASCNKKDDPSAGVKPTVKVTAKKGSGDALTSGGSVEAGDSIMFNVDVTTPGLFKVLFVQDSASKKQVAKIDKNTKLNGKEIGGGKKSLNVSIKVKTNADMVGKSQTLLFFAQDSVSQNSEKVKFKFSVAAPASPDVKKIAATKLYAILGSGASKSFFSISEGKLYSHKNVVDAGNTPVSKNIDFGYYYGATGKATLVAPASFPSNIFNISSWGTKKATKMVKTTLKAEDYTKLKTVADVDAKIKSLTVDQNKVSGLVAGDIIAFKTADSTPISGFVKVVKVQGKDGSSDYIEVEFVTNQATK